MTGVKERIKEELGTLVEQGDQLFKLVAGASEGNTEKFMSEYQGWYTRCLAVVRHLLPDRLEDFERLYHIEKRTKISAATYTISDFLQGITLVQFDSKVVTGFKLWNQVRILESAASRSDDILANIQGVLQADLFDSEIDAARDLKNNGHLRAAGVIVSVILERHLAKMCQNHGITVKKKKPTIPTFNDLLKDDDIIDIPIWQRIKYLNELRILCCHNKERDPSPDEVDELISGVDKAIKTLS